MPSSFALQDSNVLLAQLCGPPEYMFSAKQNSFLRVTFPSLLSSTYYQYHRVGMLSIFHLVDSHRNLFLYNQVGLQLKRTALKVKTSACHVYEKSWKKCLNRTLKPVMYRRRSCYVVIWDNPRHTKDDYAASIYQTLRSVVTVNQHFVGWYFVGIGLRAYVPVLSTSLWIIKLNV
jgi:hypothetical protein